VYPQIRQAGKHNDCRMWLRKVGHGPQIDGGNSHALLRHHHAIERTESGQGKEDSVKSKKMKTGEKLFKEKRVEGASVAPTSCSQ